MQPMLPGIHLHLVQLHAKLDVLDRFDEAVVRTRSKLYPVRMSMLDSEHMPISSHIRVTLGGEKTSATSTDPMDWLLSLSRPRRCTIA